MADPRRERRLYDAVPFRFNRARRVVESRLRVNGDTRPHYVICGQDPLAFRVVNWLISREDRGGGVRVTVVVPRQRRPDGPDVRSIRGVDVVTADRLDVAAFRAAGLVGAAGLALLHQDDVGNIHAALCAQEVAPRVRTVLRMFNTDLAHGVQRLLADCTVMSDASMAAPAFVAAALGEVAPTNFEHAGRRLLVARRDHVRPEHVVCGLADLTDSGRTRVLPADSRTADLVLAEATGEPVGTDLAARRLVRSRRRRGFLDVLRAIRSFATRKIGIAILVVLVALAVFSAIYARAEGVGIWDGLYLALVTALSGSDPQLDRSPLGRTMQVVLTLGGLALVPLITAAVVDGVVNARLALHAGRMRTPREGHVVVVGLGDVGTGVVRQLTDLGIEVVAIDQDQQARGAGFAAERKVPLIIGDAARLETLRQASVDTCQALVVLSTDDVTNLRAALHGQALKPGLRVVLRLFDGDLAERIQKAFGIGISRSVSYLAAPAFAAALLDRDVIATIPIERHVLLVAEVPIVTGSVLVGRPVRVASLPESVRVIALTPAGGDLPLWSPLDDRPLVAGDRLTVVARRAGLGWLLREAGPRPDDTGEDGDPDDPTPAGGPRRPAGVPGPR